MVAIIIINKNKYFWDPEVVRAIGGAIKIPSVPEFLGFSYSTPARVAFENAAVY